MRWNPLNWFKKVEQVQMPGRFALIRFSKNAKEKGVFSDENKIVEIYEGGELKGIPQPYTKELIDALTEVDELPVVEEIFKEEPFEFVESADFGSVEYRK